MNNENKDLNLIDCYLRNELDQNESAVFEKRLIDDKDFEKQYLFVKSLKEEVRQKVLREKTMLLKEYEKQFQNPKNNNVNIKRLFAIAAIAASFLLLIFFGSDMMNTRDNSHITLKYFEAYPAHVLKRSNNQNISKLKQKAFSLYGITEYKKASSLLTELCDSGDKESCFYAGVSLLGDGQMKKALTFFDLDNLPIEKNTIYWYKGLCYLNMGNESMAFETWNNIDETSSYQNDIEKIKIHQRDTLEKIK